MENRDESRLDEVRDVFLNNLDLSEYECDVYLALVRNGKSTMSKIAEVSGVPKHRVYDVAEKLRSEGYVEIVDSYPKEAYAVPPDEVLQPVKDRIEKAKEDLERTYEPVNDIGGGIAMMKSESTIQKFIKKAIKSADVDIALTLPYEVMESYREYLTNLNSGVYVKLVVSDIPERYISNGSINLEHTKELADEVHGIKSHEPVVVSADRSQGFFWTGFETAFQRQEMQGFYVTNQEFALLFDRYIDHSLLPRARTVYTKPGPREFPARYVRIEDCIEDLRLRDPQNLTVTVDGFSTTTRERVKIEGTLIDYYSGEDIVTFLRVSRDDGQGESETVRIGGWKATTLDDYEGRFITISD